jgi:hypothetical protein
LEKVIKMSQSGYTPIQIYRSATPAAVPNAANLAAGELAINTADGILFYEDSGGTVKPIAHNVTPAANGGTGLTAPGTAGNVLTSDGTTWQSTTPAASGASKGQAIAFALIFGL